MEQVDTKTELFLISSPRQLNLITGVKLKIGGSEIDPSGTIMNLCVIFIGVVFDVLLIKHKGSSPGKSTAAITATM